MNVGNLMAGESATIRFSYALLHKWTGNQLRLMLPQAVMDRDFVLQITAPTARRSAVMTGVDSIGGDGDDSVDAKGVADAQGVVGTAAARSGKEAAAIASFQPFFGGLRKAQSQNVVIVVDCSGSMAGDSIAQAKEALAAILGSLTQASEVGLGSADIFLITDGEVGSWQEIVGRFKGRGHRVFSVGVGSAVSEGFLRQLSEVTGGACELVSPNETMSARVVRHFQRIRAPRARSVRIVWPAGFDVVAPAKVGALFEGDTVVSCARYPGGLPGEPVVLEVETEDGEVLREALELVRVESGLKGNETVARLTAALRVREMEADEAADSSRLQDAAFGPEECAGVAPEDGVARGLCTGRAQQPPADSPSRIERLVELGQALPAPSRSRSWPGPSPNASMPSCGA